MNLATLGIGPAAAFHNARRLRRHTGGHPRRCARRTAHRATRRHTHWRVRRKTAAWRGEGTPHSGGRFTYSGGRTAMGSDDGDINMISVLAFGFSATGKLVEPTT